MPGWSIRTRRSMAAIRFSRRSAHPDGAGGRRDGPFEDRDALGVVADLEELGGRGEHPRDRSVARDRVFDGARLDKHRLERRPEVLDGPHTAEPIDRPDGTLLASMCTTEPPGLGRLLRRRG